MTPPAQENQNRRLAQTALLRLAQTALLRLAQTALLRPITDKTWQG
jgi:hypothetical protein